MIGRCTLNECNKGVMVVRCVFFTGLSQDGGTDFDEGIDRFKFEYVVPRINAITTKGNGVR